MLYEMVTGRPAIPAGTLGDVFGRLLRLDPARYAAELPEPFAAVVRRALAADPGRRDIRMEEIAALLA